MAPPSDPRPCSLGAVGARRLPRFNIPANRLADPDDFGAFCAMLCSEYASSIVGQNLVIDGGLVHGMF
jgi:NAD(P)-dependent dehydrogenase (short-subunit alcohol dehydrogenase family)